MCISASFQLPLVLDNRSEGIDIRFWVKVISATSDKLEEVSRGSRSPASFKSSPPAIFRRQETVASPAGAFTQTQSVGGWDIEAKLRTGLFALEKQKYHHYYEAFRNGGKTEAQKVKCAKTRSTSEMSVASMFCCLYFNALHGMTILYYIWVCGNPVLFVVRVSLEDVMLLSGLHPVGDTLVFV